MNSIEYLNMDIIFIATAFAVAYTFLRTSCEATVGQAVFTMVCGFILCTLIYTQL